MARKGWDLDLAYGEEAEEFIREIFSGEVKVEVKRDALAYQTNQVYIELTNYGTASGIATTEADYWMIFFRPERFICIKTEDLKALVDRCVRIDRVVPGGDNNSTTGALVPLDWLVYDFH